MNVILSPAAVAPLVLRPPAAAADGWQRELQVAQRNSWFPAPTRYGPRLEHVDPREDRPAERDAAENPTAVPLDGRAPEAQRARSSAVLSPSFGTALPGAGHSGTCPTCAPALLSHPAPQAAEPVPAAPSTGRADAAVPIGWSLSTRIPAATERESATSGRTLQAFVASEPVKVPVRIHIQEGALGVVVTLGIDRAAGAPSSVLPVALALELRRAVAGFGQRLAGVVCNGAAIENLDSPRRQEP